MIPKGGIPGSIRSVLVTETAVSLNQLGGNYARVQVCLQSVYCPLREEAPRCGEFTREFLSDYLQQCNGAGNENSLAMYHRFTIQNWTIAGHFCLPPLPLSPFYVRRFLVGKWNARKYSIYRVNGTTIVKTSFTCIQEDVSRAIRGFGFIFPMMWINDGDVEWKTGDRSTRKQDGSYTDCSVSYIFLNNCIDELKRDTPCNNSSRWISKNSVEGSLLRKCRGCTTLNSCLM